MQLMQRLRQTQRSARGLNALDLSLTQLKSVKSTTMGVGMRYSKEQVEIRRSFGVYVAFRSFDFHPVTSLLQLKPQNGDLVQTIPIPNSLFSIRLWDNGLDIPNECCLDFISSSTSKAMNSPESLLLLPANKFGALPFPILSQEEATGYTKKTISLGEERFDIKRGCCYVIRHPNFPDFFFDAPVMPTPGAAQPRESRAVG